MHEVCGPTMVPNCISAFCNTGSIVAWFRRTLCGGFPDGAMARLPAGHDVSYGQLNEEAEAVPPGCDGVVCLDHFQVSCDIATPQLISMFSFVLVPHCAICSLGKAFRVAELAYGYRFPARSLHPQNEHLQGNRTPYTDAMSRGAFAGLTLAAGRGHMFRSAMEGVAMGTRLILDTMAAAGYVPDSIAIAGGATRSPLWLQARLRQKQSTECICVHAYCPLWGPSCQACSCLLNIYFP
jgi:hypothetical protein